MKRTAYNDLLRWKDNKFHKPLLVDGPRRVGKTYLLREFGKAEYEKVIYFNFEENPDYKRVFFNDPEAGRVLREISSLSKVDVTPGNTLLVWDEIQSCPEALSVISDFVESDFGFDIIVCGFPAANPKAEAKIEELTRTRCIEHIRIQPFLFDEFLMAVGCDNMAGLLQSCDWGAVGSLLPKYNQHLKDYLLCGGMPQVVAAFAEGKLPHQIRAIQNDLLTAIENDFLRFAPKRHIDEITAIWHAAPSQLLDENQKFNLSKLCAGARLKDYESSIAWLVRAGLIYKVHKLGTVSMPIEFFQDKKSFKLFPFDPGLAGALAEVDPARVLVGEEALEGFNLSFLQMLVLGQIVRRGAPVCYYGVQGSTVSIDFVVQEPSRIIPVEVMPHQNGNSKAMRLFAEKNPGRKGIRASLDNHFDRELMANVPAYAVGSYLSKIV
ncbi:MAG: ATP-binding protein [Bacteroidales bacterium]|nr:ATP-binding protein [Bacteroidales bacterium]